MEQSWDCPVTEEEIMVAGIMLELPYLIFESESRLPLWGAKKKRSPVRKRKVATRLLSALKSSPSPPPSLPSNIVGSAYETEAPVEKASESSPATPLSFFPSETDEKPLPSKKKAPVNGLRKKKEQWLEMEEDLTKQHEILKREIENMRLAVDQLKAENLELKAKKQKLSQSLSKAEESRLETSESLNLEKQLTQISMETGNTTTNQDHHQQRISTRVYQQPFIKDHAVSKSEINKNSQHPCAPKISWLPSNTGGSSNVDEKVRSFAIDLNVPAQEACDFSSPSSTDLDRENKARAAQARLNRMQICRAKSHSAACKARFSVR